MGEKSWVEHLESLIDISPDSEFIFVGQPPVLPFGEAGFQSGVLDCPKWRAVREVKWAKTSRTRSHALLNNLANANPLCQFISTEKYFLEANSNIRYLDDGQMLYRDDDHLGVEGAMRCVDAFAQLIR